MLLYYITLYYYRYDFCNMGLSNSFRHVYYQENWRLKNWCFWTVVFEKTLESPLDCKKIQRVHSKGDQPWKVIGKTCWNWNSNTLATWCKELIHLKRPWCWERLNVGGEGDNRGWDGWMASPTWCTWVWAIFGSWWWTRKPGVLQSMGSQKVRHDWATELNWLSSHILSLCVCELVAQPCPTSLRSHGL